MSRNDHGKGGRGLGVSINLGRGKNESRKAGRTFFLPCVVESTQSHPNLTLLERVGRAWPCRVLSQGVVTWVLSGQVDPDDVLTKEEQIYLLVEAKEKCQRDIKAQLEKIKGIVPPLCLGQPALVELVTLWGMLSPLRGAEWG